MNRIVAYIAIVILVITSVALAESAKKLELYVNGALAFPFTPDEFSDHWKPGMLNLGGGIGYNINPITSVNFYLDWCNFGLDGEKLAHDMGAGGQVTFSGSGMSVMTITGNIKACIPFGKVRPYFWGGCGFFSLSREDGSVSGGGYVVPLEGDLESTFGFNLSVGVDYLISKTVDIFVDGRYVYGLTQSQSTSIVPLRIGVKLKL